MILLQDGRLLIQAHQKHVQQMFDLLGLKKGLQNKKTPAHADVVVVDTTDDVSPMLAKTFRTCVGILFSLAADLLHYQFVVRRCLSTSSTQPTLKSVMR